MKRAALVALSIALVAGCRDQESVTSPKAPRLSALIQDGHSAGANPHFFFLPPLSPEPKPNGPFNRRLKPVVDICSALEAPCAAGHVLTTLAPVTVDAPEQYYVNWDTGALTVPPGTSVRVLVRVGTSHILGFADVDVVATDAGKTTQTSGNFQLVRGRTLPIKFRIEQGALTPDHSCSDCVEQTISTSTAAATVVTNNQIAGAFFPQGALPQDVTVIIEATPPVAGQPCIPVNLDQFPGCYTFATDPGPTTFRQQVIAGICVEVGDLTPDQIKSLILYKLDVVTSGELTTDVVTPLENAPAAFLPCNSLAAKRNSSGLFARARDALFTLLVPAPLNAAHLGVGGLTGSFSKIGWGLPPTLNKVDGTDGLSAAAGTPVVRPPAVHLTNSHGGAVGGLPITFAVGSGGGSITAPGGGVGTAGPVSVKTDGSGVAALGSWTLGSTLGTNTVTARQIGASGSPLTFTATATSGVTVDAGGFHSCAVRAGQAFCWGNNGSGELGDGTTTGRPVPTPVGGGLSFAALSAGGSYTCGLTASGVAYCWGFNAFGDLGDGTTTDRLVPTPVAGGLSFAALSAGFAHTCGVTTSGAAYCWGFNGSGGLGDGTTTQRLVPTPVAGGLTFAALSGATGGNYTCGVTTAGAAYCWGFNGSGNLGDGTTTQRLVPTPVAGGLTFASLSAGFTHSCGVSTSGAAYCWGFNGNGNLGDGTTTQRLVPTPVAGGLTFTSVTTSDASGFVSGSAHTCGVTPTGAAYCWGTNFAGQLGDGTTANRLVPTPVADGLTFAAVSAGTNHTCGATTSGAAYCWGDNTVGELGDGTRTGRLVPTAVVFATGPDISIAGGTYTDRDGGLFGTAFLYDPTDPAATIGSVAIAGPSGWNGGAGLTIGRFQPSGMATTRSVWWVFAPAIATSGTYTATASIGGVVRSANFSIDATSTLDAPQITSVDPGTSQVSIAWTASPSAQAFLVRVNPVPYAGIVTAERVVSGTTRAFTFSGLSLVAGASYQAVVWAYDKDVTTPGAIGSQFNIGAHAVGFTPSAIP